MLYRYGDEELNITAIISGAGNQKRPRGRTRNNDTYEYKDLICAFDIETSLVKTGSHNDGTMRNPHMVDDYVSVMYIWQMQIGPDITIYGREWSEFMDTMQQIVAGIGDGDRLCFFVHNLAYEWQWLRDSKILGPYINEESVFLVKPRTPVKFTCFDDKIEFRCSYLQTNMSLDDFTEKMRVEHRKLDGVKFDYSKERYSWTALTDDELEYCVHDVLGLVEALTQECSIDHDNLYSLPLTSTGYVRRDMKKAIRKLPYGMIKKQLPTYHTYKLLREAFRGGNTHASRFMANKRIDGIITCNDEASAYPYALVTKKYPVTPFREIKAEARTIDHIIELIKKGRAVLAKLALYNVKLRDPFAPVPYISRDKCQEIYNAAYDNGRVLHADYLMLTVTDIDLQILLDMYEFDVEVVDAEFAGYGYLPDVIRDVVRTYFRKKTELKEVKGIEDNRPPEEKEFDKILYDKMKSLLNACYGMAAQNPVKLDEVYQSGEYKTGVWEYDKEDKKKKVKFWTIEEADVEDLDIYEMSHEHNIEKSTLPYQWGVWCTAHARWALQQMINSCGNQFLYCDTDSVYYYDTVDMSAYNRTVMKLSKEQNAYAVDRAGKTRYMGIAEVDKTGIISFKTLGAKKYAYLHQEKGLNITIAGVSKLRGAQELNRYAVKHGMKDGLDALSEDFVFVDAGGTASIYNDSPSEMEIDGHKIYIPTNVAITPSTYKSKLKDDYVTLLENLFYNDVFRFYELNHKHAPLPSIPV